MSAEADTAHSPTETPSASPIVEFRVNPSDLFEKLKQGAGESIVHFSSNWPAISDAGEDEYSFGHTYDLFWNINGYIRSEPKIRYQLDSDRNSRGFRLYISLNAYKRTWLTKAERFLIRSAELGIELQSAREPNEYTAEYNTKDNKGGNWRIVFGDHFISISYPAGDPFDLTSPDDISTASSLIASATSHVVSVCYSVDGKKFPNSPILFERYIPKNRVEKTSFVTCSYCNSLNAVGAGKCHSCGGALTLPK